MHYPETIGGYDVSSTFLLTFAIPTFNRLECLEMLVKSVIEQIEIINLPQAKVELLICNNASSDGTTHYLKTLTQKNVKVLNHSENIGADANVVHCFNVARGQYVWIFGDDDLPLAGTLARVISCLEENQPDLLYLPARWHTGTLKGYLNKQPSPRIPFRTEAMSLAIKANSYITFISSWIVNRQAYLKYASPKDTAKYVGTALPQLEWHLTLLARGRNLFALEGYWLVARGGNSGGYSLFDVFITNYKRILDEKLRTQHSLREFFSNYVLRSQLPGLIWGMRLGTIGRFGSLDKVRLQSALHDTRQRDWPFVTLLKLIGRVPKPLAKFIMGLCWLYTKIWLFWLAHRRWVSTK